MNNFDKNIDFKGSEVNNHLTANEHNRIGKKKKSTKAFPTKPGNWKSIGIRELNRSDIKANRQTESSYDNNNVKTTADRSKEIRNDVTPVNQPVLNNSQKHTSLSGKKEIQLPNASGLSVADFLIGTPETTTRRLIKWMETPKIAYYSEENILFDFDDVSTSLTLIVRDEICRQLGWSIPTYYRHKKGGQRKELSPSQTKTIMDIICKYSTGYMEFVNRLLRKTFVDQV